MIYQVSHKRGPDLIFTRPIHQYVEVGEVFCSDYIEVGNPFCVPSSVYFILASPYKYVGVVLDMHHDLHVYTIPEYRGKGHMRAALQKVILPHLFNSRPRRSITITVDKYESSPDASILAKRLGFKKRKVDGTKTIYSRGRKGLPYFIETRFPIQINEQRTLQLKHEADGIAKRLRQIYSEAKLGLGIGFEDKTNKWLSNLLDDVSKVGMRIDDRRCFIEESEKKHPILDRWKGYSPNLVEEEE